MAKNYGAVAALRNASLSVLPGEVHALMGANGAGKSTLVKILTGDYRPDSGNVTVLGRQFANLNPALAKSLGIRMIFQELNDAADLTVAFDVSGALVVRAGGVAARAADALDIEV